MKPPAADSAAAGLPGWFQSLGRVWSLAGCFGGVLALTGMAESLSWTLRDLPGGTSGAPRFREVTWPAGRTAVILCDVWDAHHSINAVRRLEAFAPRLNALVAAARERGAVIIHAPSDCMDAYAAHPARLRAQAALGKADPARLPAASAEWCLRLPSEAGAVYPLDQSDGGEDDDPEEHAQWAALLKSQGRNPGTPWMRQLEMIGIDGQRDYVSSLGDEVAAILEERGIRHVLLAGVHLNMCVLGRPFGLRRMVLSGRDVALVRDLTDTMYNPARWPHVPHHRGTDLMIAHVEAHVCPTVTSDQLLGGAPFRFSDREPGDGGVGEFPGGDADRDKAAWERWTRVRLPLDGAAGRGVPGGRLGEPAWLRCVVGVPSGWSRSALILEGPDWPSGAELWWNGRPHGRGTVGPAPGTWQWTLEAEATDFGTGNWLVLRVGAAGDLETPAGSRGLRVRGNGGDIGLDGGWQVRRGDDPGTAVVALPAQYGAATDMVFLP